MGEERTISARFQEGALKSRREMQREGVLTVLVGQGLEGFFAGGKKGYDAWHGRPLTPIYINRDTCIWIHMTLANLIQVILLSLASHKSDDQAERRHLPRLETASTGA